MMASEGICVRILANCAQDAGEIFVTVSGTKWYN